MASRTVAQSTIHMTEICLKAYKLAMTCYLGNLKHFPETANELTSTESKLTQLIENIEQLKSVFAGTVDLLNDEGQTIIQALIEEKANPADMQTAFDALFEVMQEVICQSCLIQAQIYNLQATTHDKELLLYLSQNHLPSLACLILRTQHTLQAWLL